MRSGGYLFLVIAIVLVTSIVSGINNSPQNYSELLLEASNMSFQYENISYNLTNDSDELYKLAEFSVSKIVIMEFCGDLVCNGTENCQNCPTDCNCIYYVDKNHANASDSNSGNFSSPFQTIQKGADVANEGDLVYIRNGTYYEWVDVNNSGSEGAPITFKAYPGEIAIIDGTDVTVPAWSGLFWIDGKDYITLEGLEIRYSYPHNEESQASQYLVIFRDSNYGVVRNCTIHDNEHYNSSGDLLAGGLANRGISGIHMSRCNNMLIEDTEVYHAGRNAINAESCNNVTIQHNYVHDTPAHNCLNIFPDTQENPQKIYTGNKLKYNILRNCSNGILVRYFSDGEITGNMFEGGSDGDSCGIRFDPRGSFDTFVDYDYDSNTTIYNNVFFDIPHNGIQSSNANSLYIRNNIFYDVSLYQIYLSSGITSGHNFSNNIYYNLGNFGWDATTYSTLSTWQSASGQDKDSFEDDPKFINVSSNDFHLRATSPAIDAGVDLGLTEDIEGNAIPQGYAPDIGTYEFFCGDNDMDGYNDSTCGGNDCNDANATINPSATEICGDGIDQDCRGYDLMCPVGSCLDEETNLKNRLDALNMETNFTLYLETNEGYNFSHSIGNWSLNSSYRSASTSKWITATIILRLVDEGYLSLDDHPQDYINDWPINSTHTLYNITLRDLLSFTSDIVYPLTQFSCMDLPYQNFTECILNIADQNKENLIQPGSAFYYNGYHLQIAGLMAINAKGMDSWQDLYIDFRNETGLFNNSEYNLPSSTNPRLAGGMNLTGQDYVDFLREYYDGNLLNTSTLSAQTTDQINGSTIIYSPTRLAIDRDWHYGYGLWIECDSDTFNCGTVVDRVSSPGAYGAYPFISYDKEYLGIISREGQDGTFREGYQIYENTELEIDSWVNCNAMIDFDNDGYNYTVDCDDNNTSIHPGAVETPYDGIDQNCSGSDLIDVDLDGYNHTVDCDDNNESIYPNATEILGNLIDEDCNGISEIVSYSSFDGSTTNFSDVTNISEVDNAVIERIGSGKIVFNGTIDFNGIDLDEYIHIGYNLIGIDSKMVPQLNITANITFYGLSINSPIIYKDDTECNDCTVLGNEGNITVQVSGFSNYSVHEEPICEAPSGYDCWYVSTNGNDTNNGSFDAPFRTIQHAINNMSGGDIVYLRDGTYIESEIFIPKSKDGTCIPITCVGAICTKPDCSNGGSWSGIKSYPGEWAIIDGQHLGQYIIGNHIGGAGSYADYNSYWRFENLEITNGGNNVSAEGYGISIPGGPYEIRYCKFSNIWGNSSEENSGAIRGYGWHDSIIEFNSFYNNSFNATIANPADIVLYSDYRYDYEYTADHGGADCYSGTNMYFFNATKCSWPVARNEIRYNFFNHSNVGFKQKGIQLFSPRNKTIGWDDTYRFWGDRIHHNIFTNTKRVSVYVNQDFAQIYNNIVDISSGAGIGMPYNFKSQNYKVVTFNNFIDNKDPSGTSMSRGRAADFYEYDYMPVYEHYGWDYNNIFVRSTSNTDYCKKLTLSITTSSFSNFCNLSTENDGLYNVSGYFNDCNYFYNQSTEDYIRMQNLTYNSTEFEEQTLIGNSPKVYSNPYDPSDLLFVGSIGADKYITRSEHELSDGIYISDGGLNANHPYLNLRIPAYVGAVNPEKDEWVENVLNLANTSFLRSSNSRRPKWIEEYTKINVSLDSPIDNYQSKNLSVEITCSAKSNVSLTNLTLYGNFNGTWMANKTNDIYGNSNDSTFHLNLSEGDYAWNCYVCDEEEDCSFAQYNRLLTLDQTGPDISIDDPKEISTESRFYLDIDLDEMVDLWYNIDNTLNISLCANCILSRDEILYLSEGTYELNVYANDSLGNIGSSSLIFDVNYSNNYFDPFDNALYVLESNLVTYDRSYSMGYMDAYPENSMIILLQLNNDTNHGENNSLFYDYSGKGNNGSCGTDNCPTQYTQGKRRYAKLFDGNDGIDISHSSSLDSLDQMTVSFWTKLHNPSNGETLVDLYSSSSDYVRLYNNYDGIRIYNNLDGAAQLNVTGFVPYADEWFHTALVINGTQWLVYIDGRLNLSIDQTLTIDDLDDGFDLSFGMRVADTNGISGVLDEIIVYNRSLSSNEVEKLVNGSYESSANLTSYPLNTSDAIKYITNVSWVENNTDMNHNITLQISANNGVNWSTVEKYGSADVVNGNSLAYRILFEGNGSRKVTIDDLNISWSNQESIESKDTICEAPSGYDCWYVSTNGNDTNNGSFDAPFRTIQHAVDNVQAGDIIYMSGGTYHETGINLDGKSGTEDAWITFKSYPGEWAIVDGQHSNWDNIFEYTWSGTISSYWKFENFEVTGAGIDNTSGNCVAFYFQGVTNVDFEYMYIHDNFGDGSGRAQGISFSHQPTAPQNITIKYSHFKDNGCLNNHNCAHITFFSDYIENPLNVDFSEAIHDNEISYNIFEGGSVGIHYKNSQYLCIDDHTATDMSHKEHGDKIHHNIFLDQDHPMIAFQDFIQIYNNIMFSSVDVNEFTVGGQSEDDREPFYAVVYNNLFKQIKPGIYHDDNNGGTNDNSNYAIPSEHDGRPFFYFYNNIIENAGIESASKNDLNILFTWSSWTEADIDMSTVHVENNLFYPRSSSEEIINLADDANDLSSETYLGRGYSSVLYTSQNSGLHPTGEDFITNPNFQLDGTHTIANGGIGGSHPYLSEVNIPLYVGAINPDDHDWVAGVIGLDNITYLMNANGTPDWIEADYILSTYCGDGTCNGTENCSSCPGDCGSCSYDNCTDGIITTSCLCTNITDNTQYPYSTGYCYNDYWHNVSWDEFVIFEDRFNNYSEDYFLDSNDYTPLGNWSYANGGTYDTYDSITHYAGEVTLSGNQGPSDRSLKVWRHGDYNSNNSQFEEFDGLLQYNEADLHTTRELYNSWSMKIPSDFSLAENSCIMNYLKMWRYYTSTEVDGSEGPLIFVNFNGNSFSSGKMQVTGAWPPGSWKDLINISEIRDGQWHSHELRIKLNTEGYSDGEIQYWLDGIERQHITGLDYESLDNESFSRAEVGIGNTGAKDCNPIGLFQDEWRAIGFDDYVIATEYIGPFYEGQFSMNYCGDGTCNGTENCSVCPEDCDVCPQDLVNLSIWSNEQALFKKETNFYANYSNNSLHISGASCNITFSDGISAFMNDTGSIYEYSRNFTYPAIYYWNVTCENTSKERQIIIDGILLADNFDDEQEGWNNTLDTNLLTNEYYGNWEGASNNGLTDISINNRHGQNGKGLRFHILNNDSYSETYAQESNIFSYDLDEYGKEGFYHRLVYGYWNRQSDLDWGSSNPNFKQLRLYTGNESIIPDIQMNSQITLYGATLLEDLYVIPDTNWHKYIWEFTPESNRTNNDGGVRLWVDDILEYQNTSVDWGNSNDEYRGSTTFRTSVITVQGNIVADYDGPEKDTYWDDFILATNKSFVDTFLSPADVCNDSDGDGYNYSIDCNDTNSTIYPGATEIPYDGIDQNCSGSDLIDVDFDGYNYTVDCNDTSNRTFPGALEICDDGIDQDCDSSDLICKQGNGTLLIEYGFEDWSGDAYTTPGYIFSDIYGDDHTNTTEVLSSCYNWSAYNGDYYIYGNWYNTSDSCLGNYGGAPHFNLGGYNSNSDFYLSDLNGSMTMYINYKFILGEGWKNNTNMPVKFLRIKWLDGGMGDDSSNLVMYNGANNHISLIGRESYWIEDVNLTDHSIDLSDGEWHNFGLFMNITSLYVDQPDHISGKLWIDNQIIIERDMNITGSYAIEHGSSGYHFMTLLSNFCGTENNGSVRYGIDDIRIWDGMPGTYCGDWICNGTENCSNCAEDCGACVITDVDGDGYNYSIDCNDTNSTIYPGATEVPYDGIDQNCSGSDWIDVDFDGYNYTVDCNDNNESIYPGATEICGDGIDQDCSGSDLDCSVPICEATSGDCWYVSTIGNDSNNGSFEEPFETIQHGLDQMNPGDYIYLRNGTYIEDNLNVNAGTAENYITIKSYPGESAVIDRGSNISNGRDPVFFLENTQYIIIENLTIMRGSMANINIGWNFPTTNIIIRNCELADVVTDDNTGHIFLTAGGQTDNITIFNNKIHDRIKGGAYNNTGCGVKIFRAKNLNISNNEIYGYLTNGIYYKHSNDDGYVSYIKNNIIHDMSGNGIQWAKSDGIIENNFIYNCSNGIRYFSEAGSCDVLVTENNILNHNSFIDCERGIWIDRSLTCPGAINTKIINNLIYNFTNNEMRGVFIFPYYYTGADTSNTTLNNNLIYSSLYLSPLRVLQTYYNITTVPITRSGNIQLNTNFVGGANPTTIEGYTLTASSPGKNAATDGFDMGANVSCVGIGKSCSLEYYYCGDGTCDGTENRSVCPEDCGVYLDADGDGYNYTIDCDDSNSSIYINTTYYEDSDDDNYTLTVENIICSDGGNITGYELFVTTEDCDDENNSIYPGADEIFGDGIDQDCSGSDDVPETSISVEIHALRSLILVNETAEFIINITNTGESNITYLNITDYYNMSHFNYTNSSVVPNLTTYGLIEWNFSIILEKNDSVIISVNLTPETNGSFANYVNVTGMDIYGNYSESVDSAIVFVGTINCTDQDLDGYGLNGGSECLYPGLIDCDDTNATKYINTTYYNDSDSDLWTIGPNQIFCTDGGDLVGYSRNQNGTDCNDSNSSINPGATEIPYDGIDQNCSGYDLIDVDLDGYNYTNDCNDTNVGIYVYTTYYQDTDLDGYTTSNITMCTNGSNIIGYSLNPSNSTDCDDNNISLYLSMILYYDSDNDGFGNSINVTICTNGTKPINFSSLSTDCDDNSSGINPNATDIKDDGIDQDCSGSDAKTVKSGGGGGGGGGCNQDWNCTDWGICLSGIQSRTCENIGSCPDSYDPPIIEQACIINITENPKDDQEIHINNSSNNSKDISTQQRIEDNKTEKLKPENNSITVRNEPISINDMITQLYSPKILWFIVPIVVIIVMITSLLLIKRKSPLEKYIIMKKKEGFSEMEIRLKLESVGWKDEQIDEVFKKIR